MDCTTLHKVDLYYSIHKNRVKGRAVRLSKSPMSTELLTKSDLRRVSSLGDTQYIVWSTRSSDVKKLCPTRKKNGQFNFFYFFLRHARKTMIFLLRKWLNHREFVYFHDKKYTECGLAMIKLCYSIIPSLEGTQIYQ